MNNDQNEQDLTPAAAAAEHEGVASPAGSGTDETPPARRRRTSTRRSSRTVAADATTETAAGTPATEEAPAAPRRRVSRSRRQSPVATVDTDAAEVTPGQAAEGETPTGIAAGTAAPDTAAGSGEAVAETPAKPARRATRTRRRAADAAPAAASEPAEAAGMQAADGGTAPAAVQLGAGTEVDAGVQVDAGMPVDAVAEAAGAAGPEGAATPESADRAAPARKPRRTAAAGTRTRRTVARKAASGPEAGVEAAPAAAMDRTAVTPLAETDVLAQVAGGAAATDAMNVTQAADGADAAQAADATDAAKATAATDAAHATHPAHEAGKDDAPRHGIVAGVADDAPGRETGRMGGAAAGGWPGEQIALDLDGGDASAGDRDDYDDEDEDDPFNRIDPLEARDDDWDDEDEDDDDGPADADPVPFFARQAPIGLKGGRRAPPPGAEKLHKILADAGIGSRRDMEDLIIAGRVSVNGLPAHVGQRVGPEDVIRVNGKPLARKRAAAASQQPQVLLYHKPTGELVTRDDPGSRPKVFDRLPRLRGARWIAVGRLDLNSEGLLIFTTSGDLANRLMHPRYGWEREYAVRVLGRVDDAIRAQLLSGVMLEDGPATLQSIEDIGGDDDGANHWYRVVILEGRNREVRRLFDAVGLTVSRLVRIRFGPIALPPRLRRGRLQALADAEVRQLQQQIRKHTAEVVREGAAAGGPAGAAARPARGQGAATGRGRGRRNETDRRSAGQTPVQGEAGQRRPAGQGAAPGRAGGRWDRTQGQQGAQPGAPGRPGRGRRGQAQGSQAQAAGAGAPGFDAGLGMMQTGAGAYRQEGGQSAGGAPVGSRHPARRRLLRGRNRTQGQEAAVQDPAREAGPRQGAGAALRAGDGASPSGQHGSQPGQERRTRGGRRNRPAGDGQTAAQGQAVQQGRGRRGGRRQADAMAGADEGTGRQNRGKRTPAKRQRTRQQGGAQAEAPSLVSVKTLEATAEKKTLTVSERRGWTETRYLPQAVSYSGDTDWSKIARETVLPDRSRPRRVKERNGNVAPRVRARPAQTARRVNYDDDNWQPTSDSAHLEGITRSMKRDERQQRWGGTPGFAARLGQPFDPNAGSGWGGQRQPDQRQPRGKRGGGAGLGGGAARPRRKNFKAR